MMACGSVHATNFIVQTAFQQNVISIISDSQLKAAYCEPTPLSSPVRCITWPDICADEETGRIVLPEPSWNQWQQAAAAISLVAQVAGKLQRTQHILDVWKNPTSGSL